MVWWIIVGESAVGDSPQTLWLNRNIIQNSVNAQEGGWKLQQVFSLLKKKKKSSTVIRAHNVLSFNRAPSPPPSSIVHGLLSTLFIILEGITPCQFRTANPWQDWSVTIKVSYLDFKFNASGLSQPMKCQICDADAAWLCTVWTQMFGRRKKTD